MYKVDIEYFEKKKKNFVILMIRVCLFWDIVYPIVWLPSERVIPSILEILLTLLFHNVVSCGILYFSLFPFIKDNNEIIKKCKYLEKHGTLYHLPFKTKVSYVRSKRGYGYQIVKIEVEYEIASGNKIVLQSDKEYNIRILDDTALMNGLVDLLIDPNDYKKYYIDFNIEEDYSGA